MVKIQDHHAPTDFMVLNMGEDEEDTPIILGRPFLNTTNAIIYVGSGQIHFQFRGEKVRVTSIVIPLMNSQKSPAPGGDIDHPNTRNQPPRNEWGEDEGLVKDEPTPPKSSSQTKQVWKEKVTSSSESPSLEVQPSRSPSLRPTDAPKE
jgi:hypothetical protein